MSPRERREALFGKETAGLCDDRPTLWSILTDPPTSSWLLPRTGGIPVSQRRTGDGPGRGPLPSGAVPDIPKTNSHAVGAAITPLRRSILLPEPVDTDLLAPFVERVEHRWITRRFALATIGDAEYPAVTGDLSFRGMQLALVGADPHPDELLTVQVALEREVVDVQGSVAYVLPRAWGSVVGLRYPQGYGLARASGAPRYSKQTHSATVDGLV